MGTTIFAIGAVAGLTLLFLLLLARRHPVMHVWPPPGAWSWQSLVFWILFRALNLSVIVLAVADIASFDNDILSRVIAGFIGLAGVVLYVCACVALGRENLYGGKAGLITSGIYRWTRNPQYATIIPAYFGIAVASGSLRCQLLAALAAAVFLQMAVAEEAWLAEAYGQAYARYRAMVPRFYNFRRLLLFCGLRISALSLMRRLPGQHPSLRKATAGGRRDSRA